MTRDHVKANDWSPDQISSSTSITQRLYRRATNIVFEDFDHDSEAALIPAAILALAMVLDLRLSQLFDRTSAERHDR